MSEHKISGSDKASTSEKPVFYVELTNEDARPPKPATLGSAGYDLWGTADTVIPPKQRICVDTGLRFHIPSSETSREFFYIRIAPRSGLAMKKGIDVLAGVVDADYLGPIKVILYNTSDEEVRIPKKDAIAQAIIERCSRLPVVQTDSVTELAIKSKMKSTRGTQGFGSTDLK